MEVSRILQWHEGVINNIVFIFGWTKVKPITSTLMVLSHLASLRTWIISSPRMVPLAKCEVAIPLDSAPKLSVQNHLLLQKSGERSALLIIENSLTIPLRINDCTSRQCGITTSGSSWPVDTVLFWRHFSCKIGVQNGLSK